MARFKDFGRPADADAEPLTFKLHDEDFTCYPAMPGKTLLDFVQRSDSENPATSAGAINDFFKKVLLPESYERFEKLCEDPNRIVTMQTLADIVSWVMETYSDRPTEGSELSPSGQ
jgi:hypothetical protein